MNYTIDSIIEAYEKGIINGMNLALSEYLRALQTKIQEEYGEEDHKTYTADELIDLIHTTAYNYTKTKNGVQV